MPRGDMRGGAWRRGPGGRKTTLGAVMRGDIRRLARRGGGSGKSIAVKADYRRFRGIRKSVRRLISSIQCRFENYAKVVNATFPSYADENPFTFRKDDFADALRKLTSEVDATCTKDDECGAAAIAAAERALKAATALHGVFDEKRTQYWEKRQADDRAAVREIIARKLSAKEAYITLGSVHLFNNFFATSVLLAGTDVEKWTAQKSPGEGPSMRPVAVESGAIFETPDHKTVRVYDLRSVREFLGPMMDADVVTIDSALIYVIPGELILLGWFLNGSTIFAAWKHEYESVGPDLMATAPSRTSFEIAQRDCTWDSCGVCDLMGRLFPARTDDGRFRSSFVVLIGAKSDD